jgi:hypothetical protein
MRFSVFGARKMAVRMHRLVAPSQKQLHSEGISAAAERAVSRRMLLMVPVLGASLVALQSAGASRASAAGFAPECALDLIAGR